MATEAYTAKASAYFGNARPDMIEFVPEGARRLLEIGCGAGDFGAALKKLRTVEIVGVELMESAAQAARQHLDKVIAADIQCEDLNLPEHSFDCLICNDVLEHLIDPWTVLARLRRYLKPDGWLVASIPNVRHHKVVRRLIWPGEWKYEESGILDRTHLRFFTRKSARELVEAGGFRVVREQGLHRSSFPVWLRFLNLLGGGALDDMRYLQFVFVAQSARSASPGTPPQ